MSDTNDENIEDMCIGDHKPRHFRENSDQYPWPIVGDPPEEPRQNALPSEVNDYEGELLAWKHDCLSPVDREWVMQTIDLLLRIVGQGVGNRDNFTSDDDFQREKLVVSCLRLANCAFREYPPQMMRAFATSLTARLDALGVFNIPGNSEGQDEIDGEIDFEEGAA